MTTDQFWELIDAAWADSPELDHQRKLAIDSNDEDALQELSGELDQTIRENYLRRLSQLDEASFTAFIQHFEERMFHIDREEIQEYTDGSDDGFLYCRCFIIGMGRRFYELVDADPSRAVMDAEAEGFGFSMYGAFEEKFGTEFERYQHHSMETCSNPDGWSN